MASIVHTDDGRDDDFSHEFEAEVVITQGPYFSGTIEASAWGGTKESARQNLIEGLFALIAELSVVTTSTIQGE